MGSVWGGSRQGMGLAPLTLLRVVLTEEPQQVVNAAEIGAIRIDPAATRAGIEVKAPAIGAHHLEVAAPLLVTERGEILTALGRIEAAAGAAALDAAPTGL